MDNKEEKKGFWRSWMTIIILVALTIMTVFLFNSHGPYVPSFQNENISMNNGTNIKTNITIVADNDTLFKNSVRVNLGVIAEDLTCVSNAGQTKNFSKIERCGQFLSENANLSLSQTSGYVVSPPLQLSLGEYRNALKYYNIGGIKLEIGARNRNLAQMGDAIGDIQNGTARINMVTHLLFTNEVYSTVPGENTTNKILIHPKITSGVGGQ